MPPLPLLRPIAWTPDLLVRVGRSLAAPRDGTSAQPGVMRLRGMPGDIRALATAFRVLAEMLAGAAAVEAGAPLPPAFHDAVPAPGSDAFWQLVWYSAAFRRDQEVLDYWEPVLSHLVAALEPDPERPGAMHIPVAGLDARAIRGVYDVVIGRRRDDTEITWRIRDLLLRLAPGVHADSGGYVCDLINRCEHRLWGVCAALGVDSLADALALVLPRARGERIERGPRWIEHWGGSRFLYWFTRDPQAPREWVEGLVDGLLPDWLAQPWRGGDFLEAALQSWWFPMERLLPVFERPDTDPYKVLVRGLITRFATGLPVPEGLWQHVLPRVVEQEWFARTLVTSWHGSRFMRSYQGHRTRVAPDDLPLIDSLFKRYADAEVAEVWARWRAAPESET
ncbi:MAG: hypothetical protein MUF00_20885 [Gemmatimonadaceae bacterium]|jgi:hypothetical protein|nr:hypothetical protein [Gemmatimonadaceae bacterium]